MDMYLSDIYTVSVNLAGLPALSLPISKSKDGGDIPIIVKNGYIYIPDDVVSRVHLNDDQVMEVDLAPTDDYEKGYSKDKFAIVIF